MVNIIKETSKGIETVGVEDAFMHEREIFFTEEVNSITSAELLRKLMHLEKEDPGKIVTLYINSPGGEVKSGLAVYDYIQLMHSPVNTVCIGTAASMGSILFLAGKERKMLAHTEIMIHDPSFGNMNIQGEKPQEIQSHLDSLKKTQGILANIIAERTGMSLEAVLDKTKSDTYLDADEALKLGIATEVISKL